MTLSIGEVLLLLGGPWWLGAALLRVLGLGAEDRLARLGWSWMIGALVTAAVTGLWLFSGRVVPEAWLAPGVVALAGVVHFAARRRPQRNPAPLPPAARWEHRVFAVAVGLTSAVVLALIIESNAVPLVRGDEAHIWAAKAKALYSFTPSDERVSVLLGFVQHADYPLWNPLLQTWVFAGAGRIVQVDNRLPIELFALALVWLLASAMRRHVRPLLASMLLIATCGHFTMLNRAATADSDIMLACGLLVTVDALMRWRHDRDSAWGHLACIGVTATIASKNEGLMLLALVALAHAPPWGPRASEFARLRSPVRLLAWCALPVAVWAATALFNAAFGLHNDLMVTVDGRGMLGRAWHGLVERGPQVLDHFVGEATRLRWSRGLLVLLCGLAVLHPRRVLLGPAALPVVVTFGGLLGYMLVFVSTPHDLYWHLATASRRCAFHVTPLAALAIAAVAARVYPAARC